MFPKNPMKITRFFHLFALLIMAALISACSDQPVFTPGSSQSSGGGSGGSGSLGPSQPTGKINAAGFYILYDPAEPIIFNSDLSYQQQNVTITVFAEDINDLTQLNGQVVNFKTEWGGWLDQKDSCVITNGQCSVTWRSGKPSTAPQDCYVAFTAWAQGEEPFFDENGNGLFDQNESFVDYEEPFLNINTNINSTFDANVFTFEGVGELIDIVDFDGRNGHDYVHDAGDGKYTGSYCAPGNTRCSGRTSMIIHYRSELLIQSPFTDSNDINGNGNTTEKINFCNYSSY